MQDHEQFEGKSHIILQGDAWATAKRMPSKSVQCIVTSPPYWALRDYGDEGQFGLEATPEEYVDKLVDLFRELRRVLRDDGTLWLNLGDSYNGSGGPGGWVDNKQTAGFKGEFRKYNNPNRNYAGLKPKNLVGIPWRCAFALQADGWYLRSDIIWHKPNPLPESVTDRPTKSHEYIFLFSKSQRYFYDHEAIKEPTAQPQGVARLTGQHKADADGFTTNGHGNSTLGTNQGELTRNKRSVWTVATRSYKGAHFATFPPALITPCILAGTSEVGNCPECGNPWVRVVERTKHPTRDVKSQRERSATSPGRTDGKTDGPEGMLDTVITTGWEPTCTCDKGAVPAVVLDPFAGSGTTLAVAVTHGRHAVGFELNSDYIELAEKRIEEAKLEAKIEVPPLEVQLNDLPLFATERNEK